MANISHFTQTVNGVSTTYDIHDADAVYLTSNQTVGGIKTFTSSPFIKHSIPYLNIVSMGYIKGVAPSSDIAQGVKFYDDETSSSANHIVGGFESIYSTSGYNALIINCRNYTQNNIQLNHTLGLYVPNDNIRSIDFRPSASNVVNLGTSTNKWKSFNGINPGALSLPSGTVGMNLIGDVSVVGTEKKLSKDITVTGFVYVDVSFSSTSSNRLNLYNNTKKYGIWVPCNSGRIRQIMPISAGDRLEFNVLDDGTTINAIQIFTCQGNV